MPNPLMLTNALKINVLLASRPRIAAGCQGVRALFAQRLITELHSLFIPRLNLTVLRNRYPEWRGTCGQFERNTQKTPAKDGLNHYQGIRVLPMESNGNGNG